LIDFSFFSKQTEFMLITIVAGARPNFMKIAPIINAMRLHQQNIPSLQYRLIHTGQHYDQKMSQEIFEQLHIPQPDRNLNCGGGTQTTQTASIMIAFEEELLEYRPDAVLVVGDVNSTMACTIVAKKSGIDVIHVEAGIRSGDMSMPEEINRIVTDSICDLYFTTSETAGAHLVHSNIAPEKIHFVGNTMIDTLNQHLHRLIVPALYVDHQLRPQHYLLLTLHRPSNVDDPHTLKKMLHHIGEYGQQMPVVFPVHPRTANIIQQNNLETPNFILSGPLSYLEFIYLVKNAKAIITDSGGITEEATVLNVPCLTMRNSTERPETIEFGTNELIGDDVHKLKSNMEKIMSNNWKSAVVPKFWDGHAAERIVDVLVTRYGYVQAQSSA
jgi:UDP-N-acetylglucosamine 2-epimerase (non-hydrolysing)